MLNLLDKVLEFQDLFFAAWAIKVNDSLICLKKEILSSIESNVDAALRFDLEAISSNIGVEMPVAASGRESNEGDLKVSQKPVNSEFQR